MIRLDRTLNIYSSIIVFIFFLRCWACYFDFDQFYSCANEIIDATWMENSF